MRSLLLICSANSCSEYFYSCFCLSVILIFLRCLRVRACAVRAARKSDIVWACFSALSHMASITSAWGSMMCVACGRDRGSSKVLSITQWSECAVQWYNVSCYRLCEHSNQSVRLCRRSPWLGRLKVGFWSLSVKLISCICCSGRIGVLKSPATRSIALGFLHRISSNHFCNCASKRFWLWYLDMYTLRAYSSNCSCTIYTKTSSRASLSDCGTVFVRSRKVRLLTIPIATPPPWRLVVWSGSLILFT